MEDVWASGPFDADKAKFWWQRKTIRQHRASLFEIREYRAEHDSEENDRIRLPEAESASIAGLCLAEVFTPSTVDGLYRAIERLPIDSSKYKEYVRGEIAGTRTATSYGGWRDVALVRRPGKFIGGDGFHDSSLPQGIDAVKVTIYTPLPSIVVLLATFVVEEDAGDLSEALRATYSSEIHSVRVTVHGSFGKLRRRIPWARPRKLGYSHGIRMPHQMQRRACEEQISRLESGASDWLAHRFPGRYAELSDKYRPVVRMLLTDELVPFANRDLALQSLELSDGFMTTWRAEDERGWAIGESGLGEDERVALIRAAARRRDVAKRTGISENESVEDRTNWRIVLDLHRNDSSLFCRWVLATILNDYTRELAELRDRSAAIEKPVRSARNLSKFLIGDGLDIATLTGDIRRYMSPVSYFRRDHVQYIEDWGDLPEKFRPRRAPRNLSNVLHKTTMEQAKKLNEDCANVSDHLASYSQLMQSAANTTLQRLVITLTSLALIVALVSLVVTLSS